MTREDIAVRILDAVSAEVERIVTERTADLCAEVHRLHLSVISECADNLCWLDNPNMGKALPEAEFLESCRRYRAQIASDKGELAAGQMTIAQLEAENERLRALLQADTRLLKSDLIRSGDENFTRPAR